jgi:hypothetical protein
MNSEIEQATNDAVKLIAKAAEDAAKVISSTAFEVVQNNRGGNDHDLIVELRVRMEDLKLAIKDLTDGTSKRIESLECNKLNIKDSYPVVYKTGIENTINDHEGRLRKNEVNITKILTYGSVLVVLIPIAERLIVSFFK